MKNGMIQLIGNIGTVKDLRYMQNGDAVFNFSIAVSKRWQSNEGEQKEVTRWYDCVAYGKTAEALVKVIVKGARVMIEADPTDLSARAWTKDNGEAQAQLSLNIRFANQVEILARREKSDAADSGTPGQAGTPAPAKADEYEDVPF